MRFTERDKRILTRLTCNKHTLSQIARQHFTSRKKAAERMKVLFDEGLVERIPQPFINKGKGEYIYYISNQGKSLNRTDHISKKSTDPYRNIYSVLHDLMITDIYLELISPVLGFNIDYYCPNHIAIRSDLQYIIPDGLAVIEKNSTGKKLLIFIEADRSTEPLSSDKTYSLEKKLEKYVYLFDYQDELNALNRLLKYPFKGFRVLIVAKTKRRMEGIKRITADLEAEFIWITTSQAITNKSIYKPIWSNYKHESLSLIEAYPNGDLDRDLVGDQIPTVRNKKRTKS
jgi:hypothetical protein